MKPTSAAVVKLGMGSQSGIYEILNTANGKRYVGSSANVGQRWKLHQRQLSQGGHHSITLQRAWDKYGPAVFVFTPLFNCAIDELLMYEQAAMDHFKPEYNIAAFAAAPMRGRKHSTEARLKIAAAGRGNSYALGVVHSAETRAHLSAVKTGVLKTAAHRAKIGAAHKGKIVSEATRAKLRGNTARLGMPHTEESKAKMSAACKARWATRRAEGL